MRRFLAIYLMEWQTCKAFPYPLPPSLRALGKVVSNKLKYGGWAIYGSDVTE